MNKKVILAFSGGLDTSLCVPYLREKGFEVITCTVDTGGFTKEDLGKIRNRIRDLGVKKYYIIDAKKDLIDKVGSFIIKGNILRGGIYPLCAGGERIVQAIEVAKIARKEKIKCIAHGSTGAGNDQIRFDVYLSALIPGVKIIAPIRENYWTRKEEIKLLEDYGYPIEEVSKDYSINMSILGNTIGGKETYGSWDTPPKNVFPGVKSLEDASNRAENMILSFLNGLPVKLDGRRYPLDNMLRRLRIIGEKHGVGKNVHLGNTILGIKGRVAFESPAFSIIIAAHKELEKLVLSQEQIFWKDHLANVYGDFLHRARYFSPLMRDIEVMIDSSQRRVCGDVNIRIYKGNVIIKGCRSKYSMMNKSFVYGEKSALWNGRDAQGFSKIYGIQDILAYRLHN